MGRLLRVALAGIALALVLAAAGQTFPSDLGVSHQIQRTFSPIAPAAWPAPTSRWR